MAAVIGKTLKTAVKVGLSKEEKKEIAKKDICRAPADRKSVGRERV